MNNGYSIEVIFGAFRKIESKIGNCMRRKFFHIFLPRNKMKIKPVQAPSLLNQSPCEKTFREVRTFFDSKFSPRDAHAYNFMLRIEINFFFCLSFSGKTQICLMHSTTQQTVIYYNKYKIEISSSSSRLESVMMKYFDIVLQ